MRNLPAQRGPRVETGVVQIGDDWPGIFIRGDDAFGYALYLDHVLSGGVEDVISGNMVETLANLLRSCDARVLDRKSS